MSLNNFSLDLWRNCVERQMKKPVLKLVGLGGFEPPTSPLSGVRSNQLSYRPKLESLAYFISGRFPDLTLLFTQNQGVRSNQLSVRPKLWSKSPQNEERALYRVSVFRQGFVISSFIKQVEKFFAALEQNVFTEKS